MSASAPFAYLPSGSLGLAFDDPFFHAWHDTLKKPIIDILKTNGMTDINSIDTCYFERPDEDDRRYDTYLVICVTMPKPAIDKSWYVCVDKIRELLRDSNWGEVVGEFIDPRLPEDHHITGIKAWDPIIAAWNRTIRVAVLKAIEPLRWIFVGVFRKRLRGYDDDVGSSGNWGGVRKSRSDDRDASSSEDTLVVKHYFELCTKGRDLERCRMRNS
jgi:hypothetical protein